MFQQDMHWLFHLVDLIPQDSNGLCYTPQMANPVHIAGKPYQQCIAYSCLLSLASALDCMSLGSMAWECVTQKHNNNQLDKSCNLRDFLSPSLQYNIQQGMGTV